MINKFILLILLSFLACTNKPGINENALPAQQLKVSGMPTDKEVVVMVMQNADVLLSVDSSCKGVGSDFTDSTIGQFLSSFLQYYTDTSAKNSISIQVVKGDNPEIKQDHWKATFMINGQTEGENWRWGISFVLLDSNHHVIDSSFRCLGGG